MNIFSHEDVKNKKQVEEGEARRGLSRYGGGMAYPSSYYTNYTNDTTNTFRYYIYDATTYTAGTWR